MDKQCKSCVFYAPPLADYTIGNCDYPVPAWIKIRVPAGGYVENYIGNDCATYKSKADVVKDALEKE